MRVQSNLEILTLLLLKPFDFAFWLAEFALLLITLVTGMVVCCLIIVAFYASLPGAVSFRDAEEISG